MNTYKIKYYSIGGSSSTGESKDSSKKKNTE